MKHIIFSENPPKNGSGILCSYSKNFFQIRNWEYVDLSNIINEMQDQWLSEIDVWHSNLSNLAIKLTKWWPLSAGSRMHIWHDESKCSFKSLLYALSIYELKKRNPNRIIVIIGAPQTVKIYFQEFETPLRIKTTFFENITFYTKLLKKIIILLAIVILNRKNIIRKVDVIVTSMSPNLNQGNKVGDHFYGNMFSDLENLDCKKIAWLFCNPLIFKKNRSKLTDKSCKNNYFNYDFLEFNKVVKSLCISIKVRNLFLKLLTQNQNFKIGELSLQVFENNYVMNLIVNYPIFNELVDYEIWCRLVKKVSPKVIFYPYEEKTSERAIQLAIKDTNHNITTIGFAHAAYTKGHLYLRGCRDFNIPKPTIIGVTGQVAKNYFSKLGYPDEKLIIIGSPRNKHISESNKIKKQHNHIKILFIAGHGFELVNLSKMLSKNNSWLEKYQLLIRRYPLGWVKEQDYGEKKIKALGLNYTSANGSLLEEIDKADIILYDSTTAGIQAVLSSKMVIQIDLSETIESNHFIGLQNINKVFNKCRNLEDLILMLNYLTSLELKEYARLAHEQRLMCEELLAPLNKEKLNQLIF